MKLQRTGFNNFSWLEAWVVFLVEWWEGQEVVGVGSWGRGSEVEECVREGRSGGALRDSL